MDHLSTAHPLLQDAFPRIRAKWGAVYTTLDLRIICGYRSIADQQKAYNERRSKLNPAAGEWSYHQYPTPGGSWAMDAGVFVGGVYDGNTLGPYKAYAALGEEEVYAPLDCSLLESLGSQIGDWPHLQLAKRVRIHLVQMALKAKRFDPGTLDGLHGQNTQRALEEAAAHYGVKPGRTDKPSLALWGRLSQ